jgi:hypothetical protein
VTCEGSGIWKPYFIFQALYQIKVPSKTVCLTNQSEHFINSYFLSLQSDWPASKEAAAAAAAAAAVLDRQR